LPEDKYLLAPDRNRYFFEEEEFVMSQSPQNELASHNIRLRWLVLAVPVTIGFLLLLSIYVTLHAASGEEINPAASMSDIAELSPVGAPAAQTTNLNRFEIRYPSIDARHTTGAAWGDYDGDGDLDLAVSNGRFNTTGPYDMSNEVYINNGRGIFEEISIDLPGQAHDSRAVAWGDTDGDGDLDLIVANFDGKNQIFENNAGMLIFDPQSEHGWQSIDSAPSTSLALGDYDGDGDLDLAVGNEGMPDQVWRNISGTFRLRWQAPVSGALQTRAVAWGDMDGDGDLDLAAAYYDGEDRIYENDNGHLRYNPANGFGWQSENRDELSASSDYCTNAVNTPGFVDQYYKTHTRSLAWGDWDGDGDLDLATGGGSDDGRSCGAFLKVYENVDGILQFDPQNNLGWEWIDSESPDKNNDKSTDKPSSLAWGDWNSDGNLDLFVGFNAGAGYGSRNRVFENIGGTLVFDPGKGIGWESTLDADLDSETTYAIAVGDADADGDLDLAVGNGGSRHGGQKNLIMRNAAPAIAFSPAPWVSPDTRKSTDTAWGDWDGDGDLDLAVANFGEANQVYENVDGSLQFDPQNDLGWESTIITDDLTTSVAWGDWDGDGDLDLAVGNKGKQDVVYENTGSTLSYSPDYGEGWASSLVSDTQSLAWGDWDRDGDLDLAAGHCSEIDGEIVPQRAVVYENDTAAKTLRLAPDETPSAGWMSPDPLCAKGVAWGDWDNDTDLDLALGSKVFENHVGDLVLNSIRGWDGRIDATSVAWGDVDGDGDLDLALGTTRENRVYENVDGNLLFNPRQGHGWESRDLKQTTDLAWGDVDGDKDLDLAVSNSADWKFQANQVFENVNGQLSSHAAWETAEPDVSEESLMRSQGLALGDMDNDGDLDLAFANYCSGSGCDSGERPNYVYTNELQGGTMLIGSLPRLSIEQPYGKGSADFYASPKVLTTNAITIPFILRDAHEVPVGRIEVFYSLDGGDNWQEAKAFEGTATTNLETSASGVRHEFIWNTFESGFFGKSDNVAIRMIAYDTPPQDQILEDGSYRYYDGIAGSFQRPFVTATSFPFRVTSTQIQVVDADNNDAPVAGAWVFRLPEGQAAGAELMPSPDNPLPTDSQGYLPGGGELEQGDRLVALSQVDASEAISFTNKVTYFHTSGPPVKNGLLMRTFTDPGEVVLKVSKDNPFLLFHITMVLEWDAQSDELFRTDLADGIMRASELLFDVTDGQAALGQVIVLQSKENWPYADVVVQANNAVRPSAAIGGFTQVPLSETVRINVSPDNLSETKVISNAYTNNQIRMGTVWDPFGEYTADLGPDWWQALAHELSHYLLFLPDNYLGFKEDNVLGKIDCQGSFMTSTFNPEYSEFLTEEGWSGICQQSLAELTTGRTDWETITNFYPVLQEPDVGKALDGPSNLPLGVTSVTFIGPNESRSTLRARNFEVRRINVEEDGSQTDTRWRLPAAQAYLFQSQGTPDLTDDMLIQLGTPTGGGDRLKVRGAFTGDRLCLFDRSGDQAYAGCDGYLTSSDVSIKVREADNEWQPEIEITPVTSRTMQVTVTQQISDGRPLNVQLFPLHYWSKPGFVRLSPTDVMDSDGDVHTKELIFRLPAYEVAAHVWVEGDPGRETIDIFKLNPPWPTAGPNASALGGPNASALGGPNASALGGPNASALGGPNASALGGPNASALGGPNASALGGPNASALGGPNASALGGAPILSADAQVVVYSKRGFFEENGVETLQILSNVPQLDSHPWLAPVGQAYQVSLDPETQDDRVIGLTYLQRDVPEGYEHTLTIYFLADGGDKWQRLETERYLENLVVADLQDTDGTYAVMSTVILPGLNPGRNQFSYPLAVTQTVSDALRSISSEYSRVFEVAMDGQERDVNDLEFGRVYWIDITASEVVTPYLAPPVTLPDGQVGFR
jgi:hypothetical protein